MDGVVIDSQAAANAALVEAAARHHVRLKVSELEDLLGASEHQFWSYVKARYGLPEPIAYYAASYNEDTEIAGYDQTLFSPGLDALFDELRAVGVPSALVACGSRKRMNAVIQLFDLARWLDVAVCREDVTGPEPTADLFLAAAAALEVAPESCLVIEHSAPGSAAARAAGMRVIPFTAYAGPNSRSSGAPVSLGSFEGLGWSELQTLWETSAKL